MNSLEEILTIGIPIKIICIAIGLLLFILSGFLWNYFIIKEMKEIKKTNSDIVTELRELNSHLENIEKKTNSDSICN